MIIGFTGTSSGMTEEQLVAVEDLVSKLIEPFDLSWVSAVHGDCVGADEDFDKIVEPKGIRRLIYPCTYEGMRAFCKDAHFVAEPKRPMQRNRDIVARAHVMIATPPNYVKIKRGSGTWATIGFTRRAKKPLYIVFPNGKIQEENVEVS